MRVLIVIPPYRTTDVLTAQLYPMPYAAVTLAASLREKGHTVVVKDFLLPPRKTTAPAPDSFRGKGAPAYYHFGESLKAATAWVHVHASEYDVVGLCMCQCNVTETGVAIARALRTAGVPFAIGGPFATTAPDQALAITGAHAVLIGEGEERIEEALTAAIETARRGPREPVRIVAEPVDIAATPLPAWDLAPLSAYPKVKGRTRGVLAVSRGCPHACAFCSVHTIMSRKYRRQDPARVRAEIMHLWRAGVRYFSFLDDNLFLTPPFTEDLLGVLADLRRTIAGFRAARFYVEEGVEVRMAARPGFLKSLVDAGFENVGLGLESVNDARLRAMKKPYKAEDLKAAVAECRKAGLTARAFYIIGFPGDTVRSVARDLVTFGKMGLAARPNNLKLYPGTAMTAEYRRLGYVDGSYDWRLSSWWTPPTDMTWKAIKRCKTVLGAIGRAAEAFGIAVFADDFDTIRTRLARKRYSLIVAGGSVTICGPMYRTTPFRHLAELLVLRMGARGARSTDGERAVTAAPTAGPRDEVQAALAEALAAGGALFTGETDMEPIDQPAVSSAPETAPLSLPFTPIRPDWRVGDSLIAIAELPAEQRVDFIFSCPPYADLERYSDDPRDLSNMPFSDFLTAYNEIIARACDRLRNDRFACFVVGDIRDPDGNYRNFVSETISAFRHAGLELYNEAILVTMVGSLPLRAGGSFRATRKLGKTHQNVLVFVKGDAKRATEAIGDVEFAEPEENAERREGADGEPDQAA
jgi:hypothetical protein